MFSYGYVKFSRRLLTWQWYSDITVFKLFAHLMLSANIKDKMWRGTKIKRGDVISSIARLSAETGLSLHQVRTALDKLTSTSEIKITNYSHFTVYTITDYDAFQSEEWADEPCPDYADTVTENDSASAKKCQTQSNERTPSGQSGVREYKEEYKRNYKNKNNYNKSYSPPAGKTSGKKFTSEPSFDLDAFLQYAMTHDPTL